MPDLLGELGGVDKMMDSRGRCLSVWAIGFQAQRHLSSLGSAVAHLTSRLQTEELVVGAKVGTYLQRFPKGTNGDTENEPRGKRVEGGGGGGRHIFG